MLRMMRVARLPSRFLIWLGLVSIGLMGGLRGLEDGAVGNDDAAALVAQLGADGFAEREAASRRLWELADAALPALREACKADDPEVRKRARKIVADLELGILVDTPAETVALLREFHSGDLKKREEVLRSLRGADKMLLRFRLLLSEKNHEWREKLVRQFAGTGDEILEALRAVGRPEEAGELLAILSPRSWAVHLMFEGQAEEKAAALTADWDDGKGPADPAQLCWLLIVTDQLEKAREVAEKSGLAALRREVCLRQQDWKALVEVAGGEIGTNPLEKLGFKAWFLSKAGDEAGAKEAIDGLVALELDSNRMVENRAASFLILGRLDLAAEDYGRDGALDTNELGILIERLDFETLAARLGADPGEEGIGEEMKRRVETLLEADEGNDASARRELFNLCRTLGEFLVRVGQKAEAKVVLLAARELVRDQASYLSYLARTCRSAGFVEEAEAMELEALKLGGNSYSLSGRFPQDRNLAQFWWDFLKSRHPDETEADRLERISGILKPKEGEDGEDVDALLAEALRWVEKQNQDERGKRYGALADHYRRLQDWNSAADYLRQESELSKTPAFPLIEAGDMFASQKRWKEAESFYGEAAELDPGSELAVYLHGRALVEGGRKEEGEALQAEALRMPLANPSRRSSFASALQSRGLTDLAWEQWNLLLKTAAHDNWDGTAFWTLRTTRYQMVSRLANEDPARAADFLESYMMTFLKTNTSMTPRSYLSYHARIAALRFEVSMTKGDWEAAIAHLRRGMAAQPGNTSQIIAAVERLSEAGRKETADELYASLAEPFERAVKRFPGSAQFHNTLADLRFRMGDRERAIALAKRCLELEPDSAVYESQLQRFSSGDEPDAEPSSMPDAQPAAGG